MPKWYDQLGSFYLQNILESEDKVSDIRNRIREVQVECATIAEILQRNKMVKIDLLHIDAEGHDYKILKSLDIDFVRPTIIIFEHKWLREDHRSARDWLKRSGYFWWESANDTVAFDVRPKFVPLGVEGNALRPNGNSNPH